MKWIVLLSMFWSQLSLAEVIQTNIPNFFVYKENTKKLKTNKASDCRAHIKKVLCLVAKDPNTNTHDSKICKNGGEAYASHFETLYDNYPKAFQQMFCSLDVIYILNEFVGTAFAGIIKDENGNITGAKMGIRKSVIDENLDLNKWASWKEQLSFGGVSGSYDIKPELPIITMSSQSRVNDFMYFVIAHEFGHIFDFANKLNNEVNCRGEDCDLTPKSYGMFSWVNNKTPRVDSDFDLRSSLCFYWCNGNFIAKEDIRETYDDLWDTNFISTYATTNPWDDFADSLAYYVMREKLNLRYEISLNDGSKLDIVHKMSLPIMRPKMDYIRDFINSKNIIYP